MTPGTFAGLAVNLWRLLEQPQGLTKQAAKELRRMDAAALKDISNLIASLTNQRAAAVRALGQL
jgi:hypothetical protein